MDEQWYRAMQEAAESVRNDPHLAALRRQAIEMEAAGLSTDGPTPPPCDPKIFTEGVEVFVTDTLGSNAIEGWVKQVAEKSGQPVDWHWNRGRARVLALGDIERVKSALAALMPEHDHLYKMAVDNLWNRSE